ncbi:MAG: AAA family ATPase, partial [Acidimicrobiia bacterium]|nr:AAA family ATPase [Acidimicrobiia bacterium]
MPALLQAWDPTCHHITATGTMVFVDISGFTAMSERLSRQGKVGAEEVVAVLNRTFTGLLDIATALGADLLKFGGDALLLWFSDTDHVTRAAAAAAGMRDRLRTIGTFDTSAGKVGLRMSVGVHSGSFDFFVVGNSHRELLVVGPGASAVAGAEASAGAGQIVLTPATAEQLPAGCVTVRTGGPPLLRKAPQVEGHPVPTPIHTDLEAFIPEGLRRVLGAAQEAEHRRATIGFLKFSGTDDLLGSLGPDALSARLHSLVAAVQDAAATYGVTFLASDVDNDGGKILLATGVPFASDGDEERMLLAMRQVVARVDDLTIRVGANRGRVFSGDVGAPYRRTYSIIGDDVNLAARVMSRAGPGQILATNDVLDRSEATFHTIQIPPFRVKGKTAPITAFIVGAQTGREDRWAGQRLPLVGREAEIQVLDQVATAAMNGEGSLVEIVGAPGAGKTRLVEELRRRTSDLRWTAIQCEEYEANTPYATLAAIMSDLLGIDESTSPTETGRQLTELVRDNAPDLVPWLPLLAIPLDAEVEATPESDAVDPKFRKGRAHDVIRDLLMAHVDEPTGIVIEQAEWMDEVSSEAMSDLVAEIGSQPWLVCSVRREIEGGFVPKRNEFSVTIKLEPLGEEETLALAEAAMGERAVAHHRLLEAIRDSGGNP